MSDDVTPKGLIVFRDKAALDEYARIAVQAERDRLLARIEALVLTCEEGCAGPGLCDGSCYRTIFQYEERAR